MRARLWSRVLVSALSIGGLASAIHFANPPPADACGCFTPPDPSVPIVQAGERIVFTSGENGVIEAHIQIQYAGNASEFGWLLPLPSEPEPLQLGTDELFAQVIATTQPKYRFDREYQGNCPFDPLAPGFGAGGPSAGEDDGTGGRDEDGSIVVIEDSVGPYDYAVLRADSKQPMLDWLAENHYFVPAGTDDVVGPYIRPGAFFLALKLRPGNDVGDLQPVVVRYRSDLPMIPIVLTSVAADPDMGIAVWILGDHRAIPRNYYHTVINDAKIDYLTFGANYVGVVTQAANEAPGGRTFVTEYAGPSSVMVNLLDYEGRFGNVDDLRAITDAEQYVNYLNSYGYAVYTQTPFGGTAPQYTSQMLAILQRYLPEPAKLLEQGITANDYYVNISYYLGWYRMTYPELFGDLDLDFDPVAMTADIDDRIVTPTLEAGAIFRAKPYLTRMFTTLSPDEMTRDPVFSFNPDLPDYTNVHSGRLVFHCGVGGISDINDAPATLVTADGWVLSLPHGINGTNPWPNYAALPFSRAIQVIHEEGPPETVVDNGGTISALIDGGGGLGCAIAPGGRRGAAVGFALLGLCLGAALRRRRAR